MSSFMLKCIAMLTMIIDHVGMVFYPEYRILRIIGRISFPIFCFLLVEGFFHTRNVYKYLGRLLLMGVISEPLFDKVVYDTWFYLKSGNVFFTLCMGLILMLLCEKMTNRYEKVIVFAAIMFLAAFIPMDYGMYGVAMIGGSYFLRENKISNVIYQGFINMILMGKTQSYAIFGIIITLFYNGKKGYKKLGYTFYILYPLHLLIILFLREFL